MSDSRLRPAARRLLLRLGWEIDRFPRAQTHLGLLRHVLDACRVDAVVDVGANEGQFGLRLRSIGWRGPVVSFEPVPDAATGLRRVAASSPPWTVHQVALGRERSSRTLRVAGNTEISSFLAPTPAYHDLLPPDQTATSGLVVDVETLNDAASDDPALVAARAAFLKVDTQGFDLEVLAGAGTFLDRVVAIQSELAVRHIYEGAPGWRESIEVIEAKGFALAGMFPIASDDRLRLLELDAVFVRG